MAIDSIAKQKSMAFSVRIVHLYQYLTTEQKEFVMAKQLLRCGTSIGANVAEAIYGSSRKDFVAKLQIALKECAETLYWLELLHNCEYLTDSMFHSLFDDCEEIRKILVSSVKSSQ